MSVQALFFKEAAFYLNDKPEIKVTVTVLKSLLNVIKI